MEKLDALTPGDEALIPVARDEWLKIGLATGPTDREAAEAAISDAYRMVGLKLPRHWIWLGNPLQGCIGAMMLIEPRIANARAFDPVVANVWKRLANEMGTQGGDPLQDLAGHDVWDRVWYQVLDQMRNQLGVEVRYQNWDRRPDRVWAQISDQVYPLVWRDGGQAADQVRDQVWIQLENQLGVEVRDQVQDQVGDDLGPHLVPKRVSAQHVVQVQFGKAVHGQHDAGWFAFFNFFYRIKRANGPNPLTPIMRAPATAGWWWPFERACIITERPVALYRDEGGRLHSNTGPALAYPDNWSIHAWHGVRIPAWFIENKRGITPDRIEAEENAELRRVMLEIFGFDKYIEARGAKLIAEDECLGLPRQLFEINIEGDRIRVLRVVNGTIEADGRQRQFHLGVPLMCNTPHEAVAWTYGRPPEKYRENIRS